MDNRYFPLVVVAVMLALGLTLTLADFRRAATMWRPLAVALICQTVLLPVLCLLITQIFDLPATLAIGLMLMAATPGGTTSSIMSHLFNGDLALNLTLTAINAVLSIVAIPAILAFSMTWFLGQGRFIPLQLDKFLAVIGLVLVPTAIGIAIRHRWPELARRLQTPVKVAAAVLLILIATSAMVHARGTLWHHLGVLSGAVVSLCLVSLTVGYLAPRLMRLAPRQATAMSLEIGMHNGVVALGIALSPQLLNNAEMAIPPAIYGVLAPFVAVSFILTVRRLDPSFRDPGRRVIPPDEQPAGFNDAR